MSDGLFHIQEDKNIILRSNGIYRQAKVYVRDGYYYAGWSGGYIGLRRHGTTHPKVMIDFMDFECETDQLGRFIEPKPKGRKRPVKAAK